jgi:lipoic acid synthetase
MQELPVINLVPENTRVKKPGWFTCQITTQEKTTAMSVHWLTNTSFTRSVKVVIARNMANAGVKERNLHDSWKCVYRSCGFCAVATGRPAAVDFDEPQRVAEAIHLMKVKHAVITSVDRDELKDGGSIIWYNTIKAVKSLNPDTTLETLIPDFKGETENILRSLKPLRSGFP